MTPRFISHQIILSIHDDLINEFGGLHGIRDPFLLDSALAQPRAQFAGEYLHSTLFLMAAAYGFHLCQNHPFLDGNKRTAFIAMTTFLEMNGIVCTIHDNDAYDLMINIATRHMSKEAVASWLESGT